MVKSFLKRMDDHGIHHLVLLFICPGCSEFGGSGLHLLPVNSLKKTPSWKFNGNFLLPTVSPSILTKYSRGVCHSFLRDGVFEYLSDSTHSLSGQRIEIPDIPDWLKPEIKD